MKLRSLLKKNKKGQVETAIIAVVTLFIVAIILFFMSHLSDDMYSALEDNFETNENINGTEADQALEKIKDVNRSVWDWAFLAIYIGLLIQMIILSFASRANPAFFWIFIILGLVVLMLGTMLSNIWQEMSSNSEFTETIARFPIMDAILGTYFPIVVTAMFFLLIIFLFGKFPGQGGEM